MTIIQYYQPLENEFQDALSPKLLDLTLEQEGQLKSTGLLTAFALPSNLGILKKLPTEIRLEIFEKYFDDCALRFSTVSSSNNGLNILRLSRRVRQEAFPFLLSRAEFIVESSESGIKRFMMFFEALRVPEFIGGWQPIQKMENLTIDLYPLQTCAKSSLPGAAGLQTAIRVFPRLAFLRGLETNSLQRITWLNCTKEEDYLMKHITRAHEIFYLKARAWRNENIAVQEAKMNDALQQLLDRNERVRGRNGRFSYLSNHHIQIPSVTGPVWQVRYKMLLPEAGLTYELCLYDADCSTADYRSHPYYTVLNSPTALFQCALKA